jgi:hypothetical protein
VRPGSARPVALRFSHSVSPALRQDAEVRVFVADEAARASLNARETAEDAAANGAVYRRRTAIRGWLTGIRHVVAGGLASVLRTACRVCNGAIARRAARTIVVAAAARTCLTCAARSRGGSATRARITSGATRARTGAAPARASGAVTGTAPATAATTHRGAARATSGWSSASTTDPGDARSCAALPGDLRSTSRAACLRQCAS